LDKPRLVGNSFASLPRHPPLPTVSILGYNKHVCVSFDSGGKVKIACISKEVILNVMGEAGIQLLGRTKAFSSKAKVSC
jgi:hypothetical protein